MEDESPTATVSISALFPHEFLTVFYFCFLLLYCFSLHSDFSVEPPTYATVKMNSCTCTLHKMQYVYSYKVCKMVILMSLFPLQGQHP